MPDVFAKLTSNLDFEIPLGSFSFRPAVWQAIAIVGLIFLLIVVLASVRRHHVDWSFKGAGFGIFFGFLLALILEGFLIIGGRTVFTELIGWENAPKPIMVALDRGREKLVEVLGVTDEIPTSNAKDKDTVDTVIDKYQTLTPEEAKKVRGMICPN